MQPADPHKQPSTHALVFDRRPDRGALAARVGARLELEREEHRRREQSPDGRLDALERRCERLEAAIASLARMVDDVDDLAQLAVERTDAA